MKSMSSRCVIRFSVALVVIWLMGTVSYASIDQLPRLDEKPTIFFPGQAIAGSTALTPAQLSPEIQAKWTGVPQWMTGYPWGGETFNASISKGVDFLGSGLTPPDYVPVRIILTASDTTYCATFRRDNSYAFGGVGVLQGSAWDMSNPGNPRRLNVCFVEDNNIKPANQLWDPIDNSLGGREYLQIMLSDYDGNGLTYSGNNLLNDAGSMDIVYGWWPMLVSGQSMFDADPASLDITPYYVKNARGIPADGQVTLTWAYFNPDPDSFTISSDASSPATSYLTAVSGSAREFLHSGLTNGSTRYYQINAWDNGLLIDQSVEFTATPEIVSSDIQLIGYLHEHSTYGDVWGYVDAATNEEYALLCARGEGLSIIHLAASGPVEVAFVETAPGASDSKDVKVYDHYAYLVNESGPIQIIDLTDPSNPVQVGTITPDGNGSHNCLVEGDYLYVVGNHGTGGLEIWSLADPESPVEVGDFQPFYYHDLDIRNDTIYACGIYGDGIDVINVANKAAPSLITRFNYTGSGAHNAELTEDGRYLFTGDEIGSAGNHTRVWDVSDVGSISKVADIIVDPAAVVHNCYVLGDLLYIAHYTEGVRIYDIRDPETPVEVAYYDTYQPAGYGYRGCWTVSPFLPSGRIIASDMQTGLYVFELDDSDGDGVYTVIDNCPNTPNPTQDDADNDGIGDLCESCQCPFQGDLNADGFLDAVDLNLTINALFFGGLNPNDPQCPVSRADLDANSVADAVDLNYLIELLFFGGAEAVDPCL
ncbi:MAG: hypothetical protein Kow0074_04460 [Candidatus Zixiibacteriota bacterium]